MIINKVPQSELFGQKSQIDFKMLSSKMLSNWYWFLLSVIVFILISFVYLRYTARIFRTTTKIIITSDKKTSATDDALAQAMGGQFGTANTVEGEAEVFKTRNLMENVVKDLKTYISYYDKGQVRSIDLYKDSPFILRIFNEGGVLKPVSLDLKFNGTKVHLYNEKFDKVVELYQQFDIPGLGKVQIEKGMGKLDPDREYTVKVSEIKQTVSNYLNNLTVTIPIKQVNIIILDFTYEVPHKSSDILKKLIEAYVQGNIIDKNKIADSTIAFIENRLRFVGQELGSVEGSVQTFKQENKVTDLAMQSSQLITSTSANTDELAKVETQISILNAIEDYVTDANTNDRIVPNGTLLEDPNFAAQVQGYNVIVLEKERSSVSRTEDNPYMKNLNIQIASARKDMLSSLRGLKRGLLITKSKIEARSNAIQGEVRNVPKVERKFLDLTRQQQIKQTLYMFLLQKREETAISKTSNISNCKIIDSPFTVGPISPNKMSVMGYGFIMGLFIPFGIIFLKDRLSSRVVSKEQVLNLTQVPIIGEIGNAGHTDQALSVIPGSRSPIAEQFRSFRTNLSFFLEGNEKKILLTSSMGGEGKSFVSLNLAAVLAISGKRVVVMELDLRKPNLSKKLNIKNDFGFTNYIVSRDMLPESIVTPVGGQDNLFVISSGVVPPNPAEMILNTRMDSLIAYLEKNFDYIIMDAPPIGVVTDAQLLSKYADLTVYVIRQNYTYKKQLEIPQEIYVNKRMNRLSILLNDVSNGSGYGYGYYEPDNVENGILGRIGRKFRKS